MPWFQDKWEALSARAQKWLQIAFGTVLALGAWLFVALSSGDESFLPMLAAAACVLIMPQIIETQTGQKLRIMRIAMIAVLIALFAVTIVYLLKTGHRVFEN